MYGVEPIRHVLTEHGVKIAGSTYYGARGRAPSKRTLRDAEVTRADRRRPRAGSVRGSVPARCGSTCGPVATTWPGAPWSG